MPKNNYDKYIKDIVLVEYVPGDFLELGVEKTNQRSWLISNLKSSFERQLGGLGINGTKVKFEVYREVE